MKVLACLVVAVVVVAHAQHVKRQLAILAAAEPLLASLIVDKLGIGKIIGNFVHNIQGFVHGHSGTIPLEGTQIVLDYEMKRCHVGRKRLFSKGLIKEYCEAVVCENKISKTCGKCTSHHQEESLKCAMTKEVETLQKLAKAAADKQG